MAKYLFICGVALSGMM